MNKLEIFAQTAFPIFSLDKKEVEELFDVQLAYVKICGGQLNYLPLMQISISVKKT